MSSVTTAFSVSNNIAYAPCRAKFVPDFDHGGLRLASIACFDKPMFKIDSGFESVDYEKSSLPEDCIINSDEVTPDPARSIRRARNAVFDLCLCNHFDLFCTLTYSPEKVDRTSYEDIYAPLKVWLSNRVQRKGLIYIAVPEYHHTSKGIHIHMLCNTSALQKELVDSGYRRVGKRNIPKANAPNGKPIYNISSWTFGFSTAMPIDGEKSVDKTAKYITKYMSKQYNEPIGGRRYLSGGKLSRPTYIYGECIDELTNGETVTFEREYDLGFTTYRQLSYL